MLLCFLLLLQACDSVAFVDRLTILNDTEYDAAVEVSDKERDGWVALTTMEKHSTDTVEEVADQGEVWVFRFSYADHEEEIEIPRRELTSNGWRVEVPESFAERLRMSGVPPSP